MWGNCSHWGRIQNINRGKHAFPLQDSQTHLCFAKVAQACRQYKRLFQRQLEIKTSNTACSTVCINYYSILREYAWENVNKATSLIQTWYSCENMIIGVKQSLWSRQKKKEVSRSRQPRAQPKNKIMKKKHPPGCLFSFFTAHKGAFLKEGIWSINATDNDAWKEIKRKPLHLCVIVRLNIFCCTFCICFLH